MEASASSSVQEIAASAETKKHSLGVWTGRAVNVA